MTSVYVEDFTQPDPASRLEVNIERWQELTANLGILEIAAANWLVRKAALSGGSLPDDDRNLPAWAGHPHPDAIPEARVSPQEWARLKPRVMPALFDLDPATRCWVLKKGLVR